MGRTNPQKKFGITLGMLRALGHPQSWPETVVSNLRRNVYQHLLGTALGASGVGFDIFILIDTKESPEEPKVGDLSACEDP